MRHIPLLCLFCATLACAGCSDDTDPLVDICRASCRPTEAPACAHLESQCVADCTRLAQQAAANADYTGRQCAECVAGQSRLVQKTADPCSATSTDIGCCFGVQHISSPQAPECASECLEPDGGAAY